MIASPLTAAAADYYTPPGWARFGPVLPKSTVKCYNSHAP